MEEFIAVVTDDAVEFNEVYRNYTGAAGYFVANNIYSRLVVHEVSAREVCPDLAVHWETLDGGRRYRFHLSRYATWHDGVPVTAHDVAYTHRHVLDNGYRGAAFLRGVDEIEALGDHVVEYRLEEPNTGFYTQLGNFVVTHIVPRHIYEGTNWAANPYNRAPVGSGPFRFAEWEPGSHILLERHDGYFGPPAQVDRVRLRIVPDLDEAVRMVADGRAHYLCRELYQARHRDLLAAAPAATVHRDRSPGVVSLGFNHARERWRDPRLREAIACAIDRADLDRFADPGWSEPYDHYLPRTLDWAFNPEARAPRHDPVRAAALLDEAGHPPDPDGVRLRVRLRHMAVFDGHGDLAQAVAERLARVGVEVEHTALDSTTWAAEVADRGDFDLAIFAGNMLPDPEITASTFTSGGHRNFCRFANPDADACYAAARALTDRAARGAQYRRLQEVWARDVEWVPLFWYVLYFARSTRYFGWSDQLDSRVPYWHWGRIRPAT